MAISSSNAEGRRARGVKRDGRRAQAAQQQRAVQREEGRAVEEATRGARPPGPRARCRASDHPGPGARRLRRAPASAAERPPRAARSRSGPASTARWCVSLTGETRGIGRHVEGEQEQPAPRSRAQARLEPQDGSEHSRRGGLAQAGDGREAGPDLGQHRGQRESRAPLVLHRPRGQPEDLRQPPVAVQLEHPGRDQRGEPHGQEQRPRDGAEGRSIRSAAAEVEKEHTAGVSLSAMAPPSETAAAGPRRRRWKARKRLVRHRREEVQLAIPQVVLERNEQGEREGGRGGRSRGLASTGSAAPPRACRQSRPERVARPRARARCSARTRGSGPEPRGIHVRE